MSDFTPQEEEPLPASCEQYSIPAGDLSYIDEDGKQQTLRINDAGLYILPGCPEAGLYLNAKMFVKDPFYGSITPIAYTVAATAIMSWLLLILLFLSQKKRPWLQKVALLLVAVTLTAGLASATDELEDQYNHGYQDADQLRSKVFGGLAFKILRVISGVILWLAHVQVALRLFAKRREEILIKGVGSLLIVLDIIFVCLADFMNPVDQFKKRFSHPLYIISVVLEIIIITTYAILVILYSIRRRKHAYNPKVWSIAALSLASVLAPLVFIIMTISNYWLAGWSALAGRVCSAAASVVVWDWIDTIDRIEKDEQKKAFMGRKVKDGDDMNNIGGSGAGGGSENASLPKYRFPMLFRRKWVISRNSSVNSHNSAATGNNNNNILSTPSPLPVIAEHHRPSTSSDDSTQESVGDNDMVVHHHPVVRNNLRMMAMNGSSSTAVDTVPDNSPVDNDDNQSLEIVQQHHHHHHQEIDISDPNNIIYNDEERPPDFFAPVHGFQPGDYHDDKQPLPEPYLERDDDHDQPGPSH